MFESFSLPRFWRRHPKGKLVGMEGTEPITLVGSGPMSREQAFLCISRDLGEVSGREGPLPGLCHQERDLGGSKDESGNCD